MRLILNLFLGAFLATAPATQPADTRARPGEWPVLPAPKVLAHGSAEHFWIARMENVPDVSQPVEQTVIYLRNGGQSTWRRMTEIPARIVDAGNRTDQLGLLLDSGDWIAASDNSNSTGAQRDNGNTTGAPLPGRAQMLCITGGGDTFWALGRPSAAEAEALFNLATAPATNPTTLPAAVTAALPVMAPAGPPRVVLFVLKQGNWQPLVELPPEFGMAGTLQMSVTGRTPYVAVLRSSRFVHILRLDLERRAWIETTKIETSSDVSNFRLLSNAPTATLWIGQANGDESLYFLSQTFPPRIVRMPDVPPDVVSQQAIAFAAGRIHLLSPDEKNPGKLIDQDFDAETGARSGPATLVPLVSASAYPDLGGPMQFIVWAALAFAIGSSYRWRKIMQDQVFDLQELNLAPLGLRLAAGLIDLAPAALPLLILIRHRGTPPQTILKIIEFAAIPLYLLHTTAVETAFGRSVGKMLMGLRVISIDGTVPTLGSLLIRNLLRLIDVGLLFFPLVVIFFSRLRQRTGDVAAGTLVVRMPSSRQDDENDESEAGQLQEAGKSERD